MARQAAAQQLRKQYLNVKFTMAPDGTLMSYPPKNPLWVKLIQLELILRQIMLFYQ